MVIGFSVVKNFVSKHLKKSRMELWRSYLGRQHSAEDPPRRKVFDRLDVIVEDIVLFATASSLVINDLCKLVFTFIDNSR